MKKVTPINRVRGRVAEICYGSASAMINKRFHCRHVLREGKPMKPRRILSALYFVAVVAYAPLAAAQALPIAEPESLGLSAQRLNNISKVFDAHIKQGKLPGVVLMIARDGKLAYSDALGFRDPVQRKAMKQDTIFRIYSMSKPLVSVAAMMLVEDGVLQLTDPVSKFLPALKDLEVSVAHVDPAFAAGEGGLRARPAVQPNKKLRYPRSDPIATDHRVFAFAAGASTGNSLGIQFGK
jgi:hypothetical protein